MLHYYYRVETEEGNFYIKTLEEIRSKRTASLYCDYAKVKWVFPISWLEYIFNKNKRK